MRRMENLFISKYLAVIVILLMAHAISAMSRHASIRDSYNVDPDAQASDQFGFLEDINFKNFFEDVGLQGSASAPQEYHLRQVAPHRNQRAESLRNVDGFFPSEDTGFQGAASNNHFTVISSNDDFYAQESSPYDSFYRYPHERYPFAASDHSHDYLTPYSPSSSHHRASFADYGPPKGFFDESFSSSFDSGDKGSEKTPEETRSDPNYDDGVTAEQKQKTKKCEKVHKDNMVCEVCKDDYGGFSEHCSHSLHSGKDQKYANTRRNAHGETVEPYKPSEDKSGSSGGSDNTSPKSASPSGSKDNNSKDDEHSAAPVSEKTSVNVKPPNPTREEKASSSAHSGAVSSSNDESSIQKDYANVPLTTTTTATTTTEQTTTPTTTTKAKRNQGVVAVITTESPHGSRGAAYSRSHSRPNPHVSQGADYSRSSSRPHQAYDSYADHSQSQGSQPETYSSASAPVPQTPYKQLDPEQNFRILGTMVKQFSNKDRAKCKKRTTSKGMTCYICPNKHGQVDEECMYENTDPKKGVHMMYQEETTY